MKKDWKVLAGLILIVVVATATHVAADEDLGATVKILNARVTAQDQRIAELEARQTGGLSPQEQRNFLKLYKELQADAANHSTMPAWMENLTFFGDFRLRYQGEGFSGRRKEDRHRARFRLRFGIKKTWLDKQVEVGFRLASGEARVNDGSNLGSSATSTNQTFDDDFSSKPIWIDRAYAKYKPNWLKGFTIIGGKFGTPMVHTDLVWDSDVNPEGFWAQYKPKFGDISPFTNVGYFILDESSSDNDTILVTYQAGFDWVVAKPTRWIFAVTYYDFDHYDNETTFRSTKGSHELPSGHFAAERFQMLNITNKVSWKAFGLPMAAYFDYILNCGDKDDGPHDFVNQNKGYALGFKVGKNKKKGDWSATYKYAYIEPNATPGGLNDADFGGSNRKGHVWGAKYNLTDFLTAGGKLFWTENVTGSSENERDTLVQADLAWKF